MYNGHLLKIKMTMIGTVIFFCALALVNSNVLNKRQAIFPRALANNIARPTTNLAIQNDEQLIVNAIQELALQVSAMNWERGHAGNVVQSPLSIAALLSLLLLASRGNSHWELKRALNYPNDMQDYVIHETFKNILNSLNDTQSGVDLSISTRLFLQERFSILGQFTEIAENSYNSQVRGLDFAGSPISSMNRINQWVERSTHGKITDLIKTPFSPNTKFVAANVIYFNGEWENVFSERLTQNGLFNTGTKNISIPMMTGLMTVPYLNGDQIGFDIIALPYKGNKYSMYILSPRGNPGIASLQRMEYDLNSKNLNNLIGLMKTKKVSVKIPRMKLSQKTYLKEGLEAFEVREIFDPKKANFGRLTTQTDVFISDIVHEAILEITESGTVAAAVSAATFDRMGGNEIFYLDRPSILFIRDNSNGLPLFWARVVEPEPLLN